MMLIELSMLIVLGLAIGSFLNVVIHRLPRKLSLVSPASQCPGCGSAIAWYDNLPVISYVLLRGRCRACRAAIGIRYPIVELVTALLFVAHYFVFGWTPLLASRLVLASAMVALFAIDMEHRVLPNALTLPGVAMGLAASLVLPPGIRDSVLGVLIGGGFLWIVGEAYFRYAGEEGMGGGDVKMLAMIGAFLGWKLTLLTLVVASIAGGLTGLVILALKRGGLKYALPFGTFLSLAAVTASLWGDRIVAWYLGQPG